MRRKTDLNKVLKIITIAVIVILFVGPISSLASNKMDSVKKSSEAPYTGHLRIYIAEKESRWDDYDGNPYHFGFMDYAYNDVLSIDYLDTFTESITWTSDIDFNNFIAIAAVFNPISHQGFALPPDKKPFDAYYVDAAAGATPGNTSYNTVTEDFTHTVFAEEGTGTWCKACPTMAEMLHNIYESGDYPFYYVALINDKNEMADDRLVTDYNIFGYPTAFYDGGKEVHVGGTPDESVYREEIESCGGREVHDLNLSLSVEELSEGEYQIDISITNNEEINYPIYEISNIKGGFMKVSATVSNIGGQDATDVDWEIKVYGGFLKLIRHTRQGTFDAIDVGTEKSMQTKYRIFGLGRADITITVGSTTNTHKGLVIGPLVIILR